MKKKYKEFCQFKLILPIKIYYIPDFENFDLGNKKLWQKKRFFCSITQSFFDLEKKFRLVNSPKQAKIIGVF